MSSIEELITEVHGLRIEVQRMITILHGDETRLGVLAKVQLMWNSYTWLLCTLSAAAGSLLTWLLLR